MSDAAPLLAVFQELRRRNFPLGIAEYALALRALEAGFGVAGPGALRESVLFLCQALWAKSLEERRQVQDAVEAALPRRLTDEQLRALDELLRSLDAQAGEEPGARGETAAAPPPPALEQSDAPAPPPPLTRAAPPTATPVGAAESIAPEQTADDALAALALPAAAPAVQAWQLNPHFDLVGTLPVTHRRMSRAWRHYRRMARQGPATELDAAATLERLCRDGVLMAPVLVPRRRNQARALVLVDASASMLPFRYVTEELITAATHSGLARVDVRWFDNAPRGFVFRDAARTDPMTIDAAAAPFRDAGVMVLSDGGAARGGRNPVRVEDSAAFIETLRVHSPAIAWLNPVPAERWAGTTAQLIRRRTGIPMFPLERGGLEDAIDTMRGLVR